jgi:glycosyltransferase involved in cell wall biosynthesis
MKIFLINSTRTWGGGEKWHLETACHLKKKGHDVTILAYARRALYQRSQAAGIRTIPVVISNFTFLNPFRLRSFIRMFRKEKPDIMILNFSADVKTCGIAAKKAGIRHIVYRRGSAIPIRNTFINRWLYKNIITHIIANSEETKRTILQNNMQLFPFEKITVIYNGIDLEQLDGQTGTQLYQKENREILIGNAGRMVLQKGQKYLIEMAKLLRQKGIDFKILIAGEGPLEKSLRQLAAEYGVENHVIFPGFIHDVKVFMDNIDIFVLPSNWEGFGYVLVEAMACRKPVVAFNISSNPEIVVNHETGFLVNPMDINAFTEKVEFLGRDPELCKSFGLAGRKRVEDLFDLENNQSKVESLLEYLVNAEIKSDRL